MKRIADEVYDHLFNGPAEDLLGRERTQSPMQFRGEPDVDAMVVQSSGPSSLSA
jgi:hypothetical protein